MNENSKTAAGKNNGTAATHGATTAMTAEYSSLWMSCDKDQTWGWKKSWFEKYRIFSCKSDV